MNLGVLVIPHAAVFVLVGDVGELQAFHKAHRTACVGRTDRVDQRQALGNTGQPCVFVVLSDLEADLSKCESSVAHRESWIWCQWPTEVVRFKSQRGNWDAAQIEARVLQGCC